jgi:hypothetical protein
VVEHGAPDLVAAMDAGEVSISAAAVRLVVRLLLSEDISREFARDSLFDSQKALDITKGTLLTGDGIGQPVITRVLANTPGITINTVRDSLSQLKSSGDYARIIQEVQIQIAADAESMTGITNQQVSKWGKRLAVLRNIGRLQAVLSVGSMAFPWWPG